MRVEHVLPPHPEFAFENLLLVGEAFEFFAMGGEDFFAEHFGLYVFEAMELVIELAVPIYEGGKRDAKVSGEAFKGPALGTEHHEFSFGFLTMHRVVDWWNVGLME